ncbi:hypothetical protein Dimus_019793 [Dionaea muscipula]
MGSKKAGSGSFDPKVYAHFLVCIVFLCLACSSYGFTNPVDVAAINGLHVSLGYPRIPGWVPSGGDPCSDAWQGVACETSDITSITLVGAGLGGELGDSLGSFSSIQLIDFSNNNIGGSIPSSLPASIRSFFLSDNNLTGSIPSSISSLTQLTGLKLNDNHLTGEIPDAFQSLSSLANLDLANNKFTGQLPLSMEDLSALSSLHLQSNELSGTLDVLQDLPLQDLDVRNNQFSGPIPQNLLSVPNFQKEGNPFNTSASPLPSPTSPPTQPSPPSPATPPQASAEAPPTPGSSTSGNNPNKHAAAPSVVAKPKSGSGKRKSGVQRIVWISIVSIIACIILILALLLCMPICLRRSRELYERSRRHEFEPSRNTMENSPSSGNLLLPPLQKNTVLGPKNEVWPEIKKDKVAAIPESRSQQDLHAQRMEALRKQGSEISESDINLMVPPPPPPPPPTSPPPPPPPPPPPLAEKVASTRSPSPSTSVRSFTIASLQQYTNSFSQDHLIASGMFGSIYRAELPHGKLLAIKKLDKVAISRLKDHEFIELVNDIDRLRHANIVDLVGYCSEHGQRLLIYEYCSNGSLQDLLDLNDDYKRKIPWDTRIQIALGAARALEYLHEVCEPPVTHRNFKATNILLDEELNVRVSDCGLGRLIVSGLASQLSGQLQSTYGYGAPEFESFGIYTYKSDIFSFGVVMLELLTGRMAHDNKRVRGEQFLARWAIPQLHDIEALSRMVDPSLNGEYPTKSLSNFADIISRCVQPEPEYRPMMSEVVQDLGRMLQRGMDLPQT